MNAKQWLIRVINLGTEAQLPEVADRIRITNSLNVILTGAALVYVLQYLLITPNALGAGLQLLFAALHGSGLLLTRSGRIGLARLWTCSAYTLDVFVFAAFVLPDTTGANLFLVLTPMISILVYLPRQQLPKYAFTAVSLGAYYLTIGVDWGPPWIAVAPHEAIVTNLTVFATCVVGLIVGAHLFTFDRLHKETELSQLAATDPLTGLLNRRAVLDIGNRLFRGVREDSRSLSAIMLDIDHFKPVNDRYGHHFGDEVLQGVAHEIRRSVRRSDYVGRYGGEEFIILLPDATADHAARIAEVLRGNVESHATVSPDGSIRCTVSLGVAGTGPGIASLDGLIRSADDALYIAKSQGRNRVSALQTMPG
ncbi:MAG: diguanylate cyclase [Ectothiorhodospiraceae bacterium]